MILALGTLLGGIGLFLLGMMHLTDGLKQSAGARLEQYLKAGTNTKKRGFLSGFSLTALVQSSSVVTVATIGFANAGLLSMGQSAWVVFGSNVGTTMTGWIVALVGFKIKVEAFALPLVGLGAFLHILGKSPRAKAIGGALAGFGLLFVGLNLLQSALADHQGNFTFIDKGHFDLWHITLFIAIGVLMTVVMQSSSASMAMILTLVNAGTIPLSLGAAAVIGANVGTTSTALLATIGATANAKRVAWVHVVFNLVAGLAALLLLPLVSEVFSVAYEQKLMGGNAAFWLAIYHTLFNLVGVLLMVPMEPAITRFLNKRFVKLEQSAQLKYVDPTIVTMPPLAAKSALLELQYQRTELEQLALKGIASETQREGAQLSKNLSQLEDFLVTALRQPMSDVPAEALSLAIKQSQRLDSLLQLQQGLGQAQAHPAKIAQLLAPAKHHFKELLLRLRKAAGQPILSASAAAGQADGRLREADQHRFSKHWVSDLNLQADKASAALLDAVKSGDCSVTEMRLAMDYLDTLKRFTRLLRKTYRDTDKLSGLLVVAG